MSIHNLLECSKNYSKTTGSFWNYFKDELSNSLSTNSEFFKCKTRITGKTYNVGDHEDDQDANKVKDKSETEIFVPLNNSSNFWRSLNILLISSKVEFTLTWCKNCVLTDIPVRTAGNKNNPPAIVAPTELEF